jgi:hypothetical protein
MTGVLPFDWRPWHWQSHAYVTPRNAEKEHKPVINCATPISTLSTEYWQRRYANAPGLWAPLSATHWFQMDEVLPYIDTYSTWECCFWCWGCMNMAWLNVYIGRKSSGQVNPYNPRTAWAHRIVLWASIARVNAAWLIGICGFFYGYEFLYTYVPGFKINDPSPEEWKHGWREGQSSFLARGAACLTCVPAWYAWKGTFKRAGNLLTAHLFIQWYYELGRCYIFPSSDRALYWHAGQDSKRYERHGSLTPEIYRGVDADANKPEWVYSYENLRFLHTSMMKQIQENKHHDYQPLGKFTCLMPNPYYDFQKAAQMDRPFKPKWKSETFKLPQVLSPTMRTGALDQVMA